MNKLRNRISEEQLRNRIFAQDDYVNLMEDMSLKHVGISGMGLFTIDYSFIFIVSFQTEVVFFNFVVLTLHKLIYQLVSTTMTYFLIVFGQP